MSKAHRASKTELFESWVLKQILHGEYAGGQNFADDAIEKYAAGINSPLAIAAYQRLDAREFVTVKPHQGTYVKAISKTDCEDAAAMWTSMMVATLKDCNPSQETAGALKTIANKMQTFKDAPNGHNEIMDLAEEFMAELYKPDANFKSRIVANCYRTIRLGERLYERPDLTSLADKFAKLAYALAEKETHAGQTMAMRAFTDIARDLLGEEKAKKLITAKGPGHSYE